MISVSGIGILAKGSDKPEPNSEISWSRAELSCDGATTSTAQGIGRNRVKNSNRSVHKNSEKNVVLRTVSALLFKS